MMARCKLAAGNTIVIHSKVLGDRHYRLIAIDGDRIWFEELDRAEIAVYAGRVQDARPVNLIAEVDAS